MRRALLAFLGLAAILVLSACGGVPATPGARVSVFAASSLTDVFRQIGAEYTRTHPGVAVEFNFQSSSALVAQLEQGAPGDVYASADAANMQRAVDRGLIEGAPVTFARNRPVIVVPADNRARISSVADLAQPGVKLVLAGPDVPIGAYARQVLDHLAADPAYGPAYRNAVLDNLVSNEANVRAVLTKVELGEADAGIVYQTDAAVSGRKVRTIALPEAANVVASYPIAAVHASANRAAAEAFIAFVTGPKGQRLLAAAGFGAP
jgi:molybdate transport system substrate-binding protein